MCYTYLQWIRKKGKKKFMKNKKHIVTGILAHVDAGKTTLSEAIYILQGIWEKSDVWIMEMHFRYLWTRTVQRNYHFSKQAEVSMNEMDLTLLDTPGMWIFLRRWREPCKCLIMRSLWSVEQMVCRVTLWHYGVCLRDIRSQHFYLLTRWIRTEHKKINCWRNYRNV